MDLSDFATFSPRKIRGVQRHIQRRRRLFPEGHDGVCRKNLGPMAWTVRAPLTPPSVNGVDPIGEVIGGQTIDHENITRLRATKKCLISRTPTADCPPSIASGPPRRTAAENRCRSARTR